MPAKSMWPISAESDTTNSRSPAPVDGSVVFAVTSVPSKSTVPALVSGVVPPKSGRVETLAEPATVPAARVTGVSEVPAA